MSYPIETLLEIYKHAETYRIQQKKPEWFSVLSLLNDKIHERGDKFDNILDIGVYDGGTSISLSYFTKRLTSLDIIPRRFRVDELNKNCSYEYLQGNSQEMVVVDAVHSRVGPVDVLMIDGDHTKQGCLNDYNNFISLVRPGGIVIFHDIVESDEHKKMNCYVHEAWNEIKTKHKDTLEIVYDNGGNKQDSVSIQKTDKPWGGIGLIFV